METDIQSAATRTTSLAVFATDGELLMRFRRHRDEQAFAEVVERHGRLVWIVCKQALRHYQDVEDAFQATFLILAQRATTIRASDSAAAWLYRVAQRTALAARRKRARRREEELTVEPPQGEEALPVIHDRQMLYVLMEELRALPERYQTPLVLRYFEGQSRRAIAEQTDSTVAQIQGRLVRGRRMLRSRLVRRGVSLSLATGAIGAASTAASAAVSPSLIAAMAASSTQFIHSGAAGGASPAAQELAKQGVTAMWYASVTKFATVAATLIVGLGIAWAAGKPGEGIEGEQAAVQVDIGETAALAAADDENDEAAIIEVAAAKSDVSQSDGKLKVVKYDVVDFSPKRQLELERDHWLLKAKAARMKANQIRALARDGRASGGEADALMMEADANLAEAKALEVARQLAGGGEKAAEVREQPLVELEQRREDNEAEIEKLVSILDKIRPSVATEAAKVEFEQLERAMLQRELEQLHAVLMQLNQAEIADSDREPSDQSKRNLQHRKDEVSAKLAAALEKLTVKMKEVAEASAALEGAKRKQLSLERQLEHLEHQKLQLTNAAAIKAALVGPKPTDKSVELKFTNENMAVLQADMARLHVQLAVLQAENAKLRRQLAERPVPTGPQRSSEIEEIEEFDPSSQRNMREIAIALHNYHNVHKSFPPHANYTGENNGKPLLSWRVHLLPFLGQEELYREFHLDEPWDSPHNKQLISRMPDVYVSPDVSLKDNRTMTLYQAPVGKGFIFNGISQGIRFQDITDGLSKTIALVEVDPKQAVIWTKPDDLEINQENPLVGLGNARPEGFLAIFADGRAEIIPSDIDADDLKALLTKAGRDEPADLPFLQ